MIFSSRTRYWLPLLPLLGLLGITYWLNLQVHPDSAKPDGVKHHNPDAIVENFSAVRLNEQGYPGFIMKAKKLLHYPDDDSTSLELPRLTLLADGKSTTHISSQQGTIAGKSDEIFLHGNIEILREAGETHDEVKIHTEYLHVIPNRAWVDTDHVVTVKSAHNILQSKGLEIDNKAHTMKLLSQVKGKYAANNK